MSAVKLFSPIRIANNFRDTLWKAIKIPCAVMLHVPQSGELYILDSSHMPGKLSKRFIVRINVGNNPKYRTDPNLIMIRCPPQDRRRDKRPYVFVACRSKVFAEECNARELKVLNPGVCGDHSIMGVEMRVEMEGSTYAANVCARLLNARKVDGMT